MARGILPDAMRDRSSFVGRWIKEHRKPGEPIGPLMSVANQAYRDEQRNQEAHHDLARNGNESIEGSGADEG